MGMTRIWLQAWSEGARRLARAGHRSLSLRLTGDDALATLTSAIPAG